MRDPTGPTGPHDPHAEQWRRLEEALLRRPGRLDIGVRQALASGGEVPQALAPYAEKVARYAYRVTDADVQALLAAGYSQDQIFEATLSVALGAAQARLRAGLDALSPGQPAGEGAAEPKDTEE